MGKGEHHWPEGKADSMLLTPEERRRTQRYTNDMTDQNMGYTNPRTAGPDVTTALEHKSELPWLTWSDADLYRLPIFREPALAAGQVYFDLRDPEHGVFEAREVTPLRGDELYVARNQAPEDLWDRLTQFRCHPHGP